MDKLTTDNLVKNFEKKYPDVKGWKFSYEYPGYFQYKKVNRCIIFTPDHDVKGELCIQVFKYNGACYVSGTDVRYHDPLTAEQMLTLVMPTIVAEDKMMMSGDDNNHCNHEGVFIGEKCPKCGRVRT